MQNSRLWILIVVFAVAMVGMIILTSPASTKSVAAAEMDFPPLKVGDTYWFGLAAGAPISGPVMTVGPYPWVEVKVDNNDANVYQINLQHVVRIKHLTK